MISLGRLIENPREIRRGVSYVPNNIFSEGASTAAYL